MSHRVIHGDCAKVLADLARDGVLVDAVVTDPPYHLASIVARLGAPDAAPIQSGATGVYARSSSGFMGQQWDGGDVAFRPATWRRVLDVMKPGAHLVAFSATKGYHRMVLDPFAGTGTTAAAAREAGFQSLSIEASADHVRDIAVRLGISADEMLAAQVAAAATDHGPQADMFL